MAKKGKSQESRVKSQEIATRATARARRIKQPKYKSFRVSKRIRTPKEPLKGSFKLFGACIQFLFRKKRLFGGIVLVYLILTIVLVKGFGVGTNISELKSTIQELFQGSGSQLWTGLTLFGTLLSNINAASNEMGNAYQSILLIVISLVLIWALRHSMASKKIKLTIRDAFYKSLTPLIPFLLVLCVIGLQLVPLIVANFIYGVVINGGLAVTAPEKALWILLIGLLVLLSLYMITSSIFALYIVTLPDVTPVQALRTARELVRYRRLIIMRKVLFLPVALLVLCAIIILPLIFVSPTVAEWLFFVLSMFALAILHSYFYHLYRELI